MLTSLCKHHLLCGAMKQNLCILLYSVVLLRIFSAMSSGKMFLTVSSFHFCSPSIMKELTISLPLLREICCRVPEVMPGIQLSSYVCILLPSPTLHSRPSCSTFLPYIRLRQVYEDDLGHLAVQKSLLDSTFLLKPWHTMN